MKKFLTTIIIALAAQGGLLAQTGSDGAFYVYRTDGRFNVFHDADVDSITYSRYDAEGVLHDEWQTQLVHSRGIVTAIPLSAIDSVSFVAPKAGTTGIDYAEQPADDVAGSGTASEPYEVSGDAPLSVTLQAVSHYTDASGGQHTAKPMASVSLKAKNAANFVGELEALSTLIQTQDPTVTQTGDNPVVYHYRGSFATLGQVFDLETSYEVYRTENGEVMPYLKFGEPKLVKIEVRERARTRAVVNDTTYYDVTAKFELPVEGVNTKEELNETLSFDVNYTGGVVTSTDVPVELVKTEYRKDMLYHAPHDNISSTSQCVVYRDNYYSDGSVKTDEFYGLRWDFLERGVAVSNRGTLVEGESGVNPVYTLDNALFYRIIYHNKVMGDDGVQKTICSTEIYGEGVPDLSGLSVTWQGALDWTSDYAEKTPPSDLGLYGSEAGDGSMYDASNPVDGFYFYPVDNSVDNFVEYKKNGSWTTLFALKLILNWYDRFFSIDGEVISFEEYRPVVRDTQNALTYEEVPATANRGPARVYTLEAKGEYLGKEIHLMLVDTVFVTPTTTTEIPIMMNEATDVSASKAILSCSLPGGEDVALKDVAFLVKLYSTTYRVPATSKSDDGVYSAEVPIMRPNMNIEYYASVSNELYHGKSEVLTLTTPEKYTEEDAVDLGLSVLWSKHHNVDAYYANGIRGTSYNPHADVSLPAEWGDGWRIPTKAEWEELCQKCSWTEYKNTFQDIGLDDRGDIAITGANGNKIYLYDVHDVGLNLLTADPCSGDGYYWLINLKRNPCSYRFVEDYAIYSNYYNIRLVRDK